MTSRVPEKLQDQLFQLLIIGSGTEIVHTGEKGRVSGCILFLQKILEDISLDQAALILVDLPESRVKGNIAEIIAQDKGKKAVHRRDLRLVQEDLLPAEMGVARIPAETGGKSLTDTLPHLRCRRPGEGHDQKSVYVQRVVSFTDQTHDPFHQNCGLAAAGGCRNKDVVVLCIQDLLLRRCKLYCHDYLPSFKTRWYSSE